MNLYCYNAEVVCFANDNDALVPEKWAFEGLMQLEEQMVVANLVHRDFENEVASYGDTVNAHRPGEFKIRRKTDATTTLDKQDATATNVAVKLNQWFYNSFIIKDGEQSKSFKDLLSLYLVPSMRTIARAVDRSLLGHVHKFASLGTPAGRVGRLLNLDSSTSHEQVLEAREILNSNNAPLDENRSLILSSMSETALLKNTMFLKALERGDGGKALEDARLGRILGFDTYLAQNTPYCNLLSADVVTGTVTSAQVVGATGTITVSVSAHEVEPGEFVNYAGNDQPTWATAATASTNTTAITLNEALKYATGAGAVVTVYKKQTVTAGEVINYDGQINITHTTSVPPQVGQLIAFGTSTRHVYTIIEVDVVDTTHAEIMLDRPLDVALTTSDDCFPGPAGSFNLALHKEAIALVTRPLAVPPSVFGVMSGVGAYNDIGMRVTMQYDIDAGGTVVNCDILAGIKELDTNLAVTMLG